MICFCRSINKLQVQRSIDFVAFQLASRLFLSFLSFHLFNIIVICCSASTSLYFLYSLSDSEPLAHAHLTHSIFQFEINACAYGLIAFLLLLIITFISHFTSIYVSNLLQNLLLVIFCLYTCFFALPVIYHKRYKN